MEAFVSYSHVDEDEFRVIYQALSDVGIHTFDVASLPLGSSVVEGIAEAMERADIFVVLLSKRYFESEFARFELAAAVAQSTDSGKPIIPVVVDPDLPTREIPSLLARYTWLDMRDPKKRSVALGRLTTDLMEQRSMATTDESLTREEEVLRIQLGMLEVERLAAEKANLEQRRQLWTAFLWTSITAFITTATLVLTFSPAVNWVSYVGVSLVSVVVALLVERLVDRRLDKASTSPESKRSDD